PNADRENLVVLTGAEASKVLFKATIQGKAPGVAEAVEFISGGKKYTVEAKREVLVSASKSVAPGRIMELSGIGDRNLLTQFSIETLIDLPGVGENLIDQTYTLIDFVAKKLVKTLGAPLPPLVDLPLFNPASAYK
ncbi:GMC oxidoreductase-domain-containing protein, partial [Russula dissimulans]